MQIGYLGLGKMGFNMVLRLLEKNHKVIAWNRSPEPREKAAQAGAAVAESVEEVVNSLQSPRVIWLMLPGGKITDQYIEQLASLLEKGDTIIDGANGFYKDAVNRGEMLAKKGIHFIDVGVSGGPKGARNGACLMIGGKPEHCEQLRSLFKDLSSPDAYAFFPGFGAGQFVKMVHNGIEYGMMQAIAEGFAVLKASPFAINLSEAARIYNNRSVIESRLMGWLQQAFDKHGEDLSSYDGTVGQLGEGKWTVDEAKTMNIPVKNIEQSVQFRFDSKDNPSYTGKVVQAIRTEFGGKRSKDDKPPKLKKDG